MDGFLNREHIPTSSSRRARGERRIATGQVREPQMQYQVAPELDTPPVIDFASDAEIVRTVVEGERLTYGCLFNPAFATEISLIDPLPHQRIAVYDCMLHQSRLRFLLADDAGAGKTIMTGLYIREMLTRRLISRVLIVPPAGLFGNWERELRTLFNLPFRIITGNDARSGNPFIGSRSDLLMICVFANAFFLLGLTGTHHLQWYEALVVSLTAFHGCGFFSEQFRPADPQAIIAAIEAVVGLVIEISFIATFTQRFFGK